MSPSRATGDSLDLDSARAQAAVTRLVDAYREFGHYLADLDPLKLKPRNQTFELLEPGCVRADRGRPEARFLQQVERCGLFHARGADRHPA